MLGKKYQRQEIGCKSLDRALQIASALVQESYCVLMSREENFFIVNYEYSENADRNGIIFMSIDEHEENEDEFIQEFKKDLREDIENEFKSGLRESDKEITLKDILENS